MKYSRTLLIASLLFSQLYADPQVKQEEIEPLTTTEFETLFEIVDLEDNAALPEEKIEAPAEAPLVMHEEAKAKEPAPARTDILVLDEPKADKQVAVVKKPSKEEITPSLSSSFAIEVKFDQVFAGSPIIYSVLLVMSVLAFFIWLYSQIHLRALANVPDNITKNLRNKLTSNQYDEALALCLEKDNLFCKMLASGISVRKYGLQLMVDTMKAEGRRSSIKFWQKIALLNDIAIIAPMLGLLGTVLGMFYAFYDVNRSIESVSALFNGLGISVGTTLAGLIVAIFAMILHSIARYRLVKRLAYIENEAQLFATMIDNKTTQF